MKNVMNQMIAIASVVGLCAAAACGQHSPVAPDAGRTAGQGTAITASEASNESDRAQASVFSAACDITGAMAGFRTALGTLNPNVPGEVGEKGGRREVNWDAVPSTATNTLTFPGDFFNQNFSPRARGVVFSTNGSGLSVSDNDFRFINQAYDAQFNAFSPVRTFSAIGSAESRVDFFVAGTSTPARSTGFGVVFSDVDHMGSASITLRGANGNSLGVYHAPPCAGGFSFIGVQFPSLLVAAVDIRSGQGPLGPDAADVSDRDHGPARDLVIMDDFIYGEPRAVR
jgi:predicted small lipoprotein YifL